MNRKLFFTLIALAFLLTNCNSTKNESTGNKENTAMTGTKVIHLTTEAFKQKVFNFDVNKEWKYEGDKPAIIDFYATWCGPCKQMSPILDGFSNKYNGKIVVYKIDVDQEKQLAQSFGIQSIPTFILIPMNGQPQIMQGAVPQESFEKAINEVLLKKL